MWGRRRGFTYFEIAIVMALFFVFLAMGVGLARQSHGRPQSRTAAQVLAAFLSSQRELARASGQPVAVVWPGHPDATSLSLACEALQGWQQPHRVDRLDLSRDFPQTEMFVGRWNSLVNSFTDQRPLWGSRDDEWDPSQYLSSRPNDPALIFLPSGKVTARGCWRLADNYVLVVGKHLQASAGMLRAADNCFTVRISPNGWVDWDQQLLDGSLAAPGAGGSSLAQLPAATLSTQGPRLRSLRIDPDPAQLRLPAGVEALVSGDGFLSLTVEADCPSGQALFVAWSGPAGAFSSSLRRPMQWDPAAGLWRGEVHWRPPSTANNGDQFRLTCHVTDESGREAPQTVTSQVDLEVRDQKARMAFIEVAPAPDNSHLMQVVNEDGTGKRALISKLTSNGHAAPKASWSPDGTRLAYLSMDGGSMRLWTCNADGSASRCLDRQLPGQAVSLQGVHWSADGTWLAHVRALGTDRQQLFVVHPDGSGGQCLNTGSSSDSFVVHFVGSATNSNVVSRDNSVFSADGKYVATLVSSTLDRSTQTHIQCYPMPGSGATAVSVPTAGFGLCWNVVWNPVQPFLAFASSGGLKIYDVTTSTYFQVPPASNQYAAGPGCFSPEGRRYLFGRGNDLFMADLQPGYRLTVTPLLLHGQMMGWLDEDRITYWKSNPSDLWVHDLADGQEQNLTHQGSDAMFCGWTR